MLSTASSPRARPSGPPSMSHNTSGHRPSTLSPSSPNSCPSPMITAQTKFFLLSHSLQRRLTHFSRVCSPGTIRVPSLKLQAAVEDAAFSLLQIPQDPHATKLSQPAPHVCVHYHSYGTLVRHSLTLLSPVLNGWHPSGANLLLKCANSMTRAHATPGATPPLPCNRHPRHTGTTPPDHCSNYICKGLSTVLCGRSTNSPRLHAQSPLDTVRVHPTSALSLIHI